MPLPRIARLRLSLPGPVPEAGAGALRLLQAEIAALAGCARRLRACPAPGGSTGAASAAAWRPRRARRSASAPTLPILPAAGRRDIGFLLPLFAFAGLEKVVMRQAQVLRARGWRTHLVVAGALRMDWGPELAESFDSVTLFQGLGEDRLEYDTGYFGGTTSRMGADPGAADALGVLAHCDAVINTHAVACPRSGRAAAPAGHQGVRRAAPGGAHALGRATWQPARAGRL